MTPKLRKRESAAERDERIVAEAGPWWVDGTCISANTYGSVDYPQERRALKAAARVLNRIAKRRGE